MKILVKLVCVTAVVISYSVYAEDESGTHTYAALQNCMAEAFDVADNGSYEQYCIEQYMIKTSEEE